MYTKSTNFELSMSIIGKETWHNIYQLNKKKIKKLKRNYSIATRQKLDHFCFASYGPTMQVVYVLQAMYF